MALPNTTSLTVVIPAKNEESYLPKLLASLKRQTVQPEAVIVADAQSTDKTREIAKQFGAMVVEGAMPGVGRNRGAAVATSSLILFLDADVELTDATFIERALKEMEKRGLDAATCEIEPMEAGKVDKFMYGAYNRYTKALQHVFAHAPGFCIFARRAIHEQIGGFDESITFCEDHDYVQRAAKVGRFGILNVRIPVSIRRSKRDGRLQVACKYVLAELHLVTVGPIRHNFFHYTFGHEKKDEAVKKG